MCYYFLLNVSVLFLEIFMFFVIVFCFDKSFSSFSVFLSRRGGFGPSFRVGVGPSFFLGVRFGPFLFGVEVSPSSLGLELALPTLWVGVRPSGLVGPSFLWVGIGLFSRGRGWPFGSGLARPRPKRGEGQTQPKRVEWEGQEPSQKEGQESARPDPRVKEG